MEREISSIVLDKSAMFETNTRLLPIYIREKFSADYIHWKIKDKGDFGDLNTFIGKSSNYSHYII